MLQMMSTRAEDLRTHTLYQHRPLVDASCTYFDEWTSKVSHLGYLSFEMTYSASVDDHLEHCQFGFFQAILTYGHEKEVIWTQKIGPQTESITEYPKPFDLGLIQNYAENNGFKTRLWQILSPHTEQTIILSVQW